MNRYANMIALAKRNPFRSVDEIILTDESVSEPVKLLGVKNVSSVPNAFIRQLEVTGQYLLHTLDKSALGGRAIDLDLINPITGRYMTGSSSGTAINVFLGINDIGIGLDGGGSVLAPAMSLNLFGFISPLIEADALARTVKRSTDGIDFTPSLGYMTVTLAPLLELIRHSVPVESNTREPLVFISPSDQTAYPFATQAIDFPDILGQRPILIRFLQKSLAECDVLISPEGPIDLVGIGDTIYGHFDERTQADQRKAKKGLLRVVNMAHASAICVPQKSLAAGILLICESKPDKIGKMLELAAKLEVEMDELIEHYFRDPKRYDNDHFIKW